MKKTRLAFLLVFVAAAIGGIYWYYRNIHEPRKYEALEKKIILSAIAALDNDRIAGQTLHIAIPGTTLNEEARRAIAAIKPGGIILFGFNLQNAGQIKKLTADLQKLAAELVLPPFLISTDQEGGYVRRVTDGVLQTPPAMDLGATGDSQICHSTGYHVSRDLGTLGIHVFFAPIVDINNNPQNPVIGLRSFGRTIDTVLKCALPFEQGARHAMHEGGAMPVIKHFPGHGDTETDSHWALPVINKGIEELRKFELVPFANAISSGAQAVMTAHILYPQIDADHPATLSNRWLSGILRSELGFSGLVFTDAMEMNAVSQNFRTLDRPVTALLAGADVLLYTSWQEEPAEAQRRILMAIQTGKLATGYGSEGRPLPLQRALENQLRRKLPLLEVTRYLTPEEASWYLRYRDSSLRQAQSNMPIALSKEELKARFADIRWSAKEKRRGPIWLAGRKNPPKAP